MSTQFCKVGKIKFGLNEVLNIKEVEKNYLKFTEEAYNLLQSDSSLSDFLYHEASKLRKIILSLKNSKTNDVDPAF
ncbi:Lacal_2735 family protein [Gelidibacter mesophilus]|uniref:Lacal_2735 family protein n=1 Tax=Gelidibacter mesophilus TaxID=169050 RepID=UPI0003F7B01F|nr:Lacal_2735 family protein [Gelidibacter mesophilus]